MITLRSGSSTPAGDRLSREVIAVAVRWYLRYGLSYRDVEELPAERGIQVDHVTVYRWVQWFAAEFIDAARPAGHASGDRWFVDDTYVKVAGAGPTSTEPSISTVRSSTLWSPNVAMPMLHGCFFARALTHGPWPADITTDRAPVETQQTCRSTPHACVAASGRHSRSTGKRYLVARRRP